MTTPQRIPDRSDVRALLATCRSDTRTGIRDRAMIYLLADVGARPVEVLALFPADLRRGEAPAVRLWNVKRRSEAERDPERLPAWEQRQLELVAGWTRRSPAEALAKRERRELEIGLATADSLDAWLVERGRILGRRHGVARPVFLTTRGSRDALAELQGRDAHKTEAGAPLSPRALQAMLASRSRKAGLGWTLTARHLRRFAAVREIEGGGDVRDARRILGHRSIATTARYLDDAGLHRRAARRELLDRGI